MKRELVLLREQMEEKGVDLYILPMTDFHGSEYISGHFKTIEYISGFTGSAGEMVITHKEAFLWTDGRYHLQAEKQLAGTGIQLMKSGEDGVKPMEEFLADILEKGQVVGFDSRVVTGEKFDKMAEHLAGAGVFVNYNIDLVKNIWKDRPELKSNEIVQVPLMQAGKSFKQKLKLVTEEMDKVSASHLLLTKLDDIAWLFNLRGSDIPYNQVFYSFALINKADGWAKLYLLDPESAIYLVDSSVILSHYVNIYKDLSQLTNEDSLMLDFNFTSTSLIKMIPRETKILAYDSPVSIIKQVKNPMELAGAQRAQIKDALALTKFIYWIKKSYKGEDEVSASQKLNSFRKADPEYIGDSFETISAMGENGAIVHYSPKKDQCAELTDGFYLVDSGAHYESGTTDITRTILLGNEITQEMKEYYTLVLKAHIGLSRAIFDKVATGKELDEIPRKIVAESGLNYNHGTGHGIGHRLCVHEGPARISPLATDVNFKEGMILSNEPALYLEDKYGIRIEDDLVVVGAHEELCISAAKDLGLDEPEELMAFKSLTIVPFEPAAIEARMLNEEEIKYINDYNKRVLTTIGPLVPEDVKLWLENQCKEI